MARTSNPRPAKSRANARLDFVEVLEFQQKLLLTAALTDRMAEQWQQEHGERWVEEMRKIVPVSVGKDDRRIGASEDVHLRDEMRQVTPGGISFGDAFWWHFLEYGTVKMSPRPFIRPAMKKIRTPARKDAAERAISLLRTGSA